MGDAHGDALRLLKGDHSATSHSVAGSCFMSDSGSRHLAPRGGLGPARAPFAPLGDIARPGALEGSRAAPGAPAPGGSGGAADGCCCRCCRARRHSRFARARRSTSSCDVIKVWGVSWAAR